jgi:hypothetical protein
MFNICPCCGMYSEEKTIDPSGPYAICRHCGYAHPFRQLPLFIVTGASGSGKSAACLQLVPILSECVVLEADLFWRPEFSTPENNYRDFRNLCLRVAKNIGQAGRPVVLCGTAIPEQYETCPERIYFAGTYYLALVCDDAAIQQRLQDRPPWRESSSRDRIAETVEFNRWLKDNATQTTPPMTLLDTTHAPIQTTAGQIAGWVRWNLRQLR